MVVNFRLHITFSGYIYIVRHTLFYIFYIFAHLILIILIIFFIKQT